VPDARTHDAVGLATAPVVGAAVEAWAGGGLGLLACAAHVWGTLMLSPDLDLDSAIDNRWGPLRFVWIPYTKALPHRSVFSHSGVSVFLRLGYLLAVFEVGLLLAGLAGALSPAAVNGALWAAAQAHPYHLAAVAVGLFTSDLFHTLADGI
jgi:uncharacterized metal-binding protein